MKSATLIGIVVVALVVIGGVWWLMSQNAAPASGTPTTNSENPSSGADATQSGTEASNSSAGAPVASILTLKASATAGTYLASANDMTLYTYGKDTSGVSNCTGTCATNWPPYGVKVGDAILASTGITGRLGTLTRTDGTLQLTYNGMPLYLWVKDTKAGDVTGNNVGGFVVAKP